MFALGDLHLALSDAGAATHWFERLRTTLSEIEFLDVDLAPGPEMTEAHLRSGAERAAAATAQDYLERATAKGQPRALARAHRAAALTCPDAADRTSLFERALELHSGSLDLFEEARTRLAYGAALRRSRSRVAARPHLRLALDAFERLGARPWADLAASEFDATGEKVRRGSGGVLGVLTSQEIRIARMLSDANDERDCCSAVLEPEDGRVPSAPRLSEAACRLSGRIARRGDRGDLDR